jgi:hypothetical protein
VASRLHGSVACVLHALSFADIKYARSHSGARKKQSERANSWNNE